MLGYTMTISINVIGGLMTVTSYDTDFIRWTEEQASFLLAGDFEHLDLTNIAEEIIDMGNSEVRALESRMIVLIMHLIKCSYQPQRHTRSWDNTITEQRYRINRAIKKMPSLKSKMDEDFWYSIWKLARLRAENETGIEQKFFPSELPWSVSDILTDGWYPPIITH